MKKLVSALGFCASVIGKLQVDLLDVYLAYLSDNNTCYHMPTSFTGLLEITFYMLLESPGVLYSIYFVRMDVFSYIHIYFTWMALSGGNFHHISIMGSIGIYTGGCVITN